MMRHGTIELILLGLAFLLLQFWWIKITLKNGRTGEVDKWGQRLRSKQKDEIEKNKEKLERLFRSK